jgi:zinc-ribbon domain
MAYCRNCGKEIQETALTCSSCGATQLPQSGSLKRSTGSLIGWAVVWTIVFWFGSLFATGFVIGASNPKTGQAEAQKAGESLSGIFLLMSLGVSSGLTAAGKLPGTTKIKSQSDYNQ